MTSRSKSCGRRRVAPHHQQSELADPSIANGLGTTDCPPRRVGRRRPPSIESKPVERSSSRRHVLPTAVTRPKDTDGVYVHRKMNIKWEEGMAGKPTLLPPGGGRAELRHFNTAPQQQLDVSPRPGKMMLRQQQQAKDSNKGEEAEGGLEGKGRRRIYREAKKLLEDEAGNILDGLPLHQHPVHTVGFYATEGSLVPGSTFVRGDKPKNLPRHATAWQAFDGPKSCSRSTPVSDKALQDKQSVKELVDWILVATVLSEGGIMVEMMHQ
eukprot:GHVS01021558.1.p1 GENE.GHVS01021558.1~~GHVS01021558.1.p1  ORF type:complete len:268 (-),score=57.07 GHVS01021558.1:199-1002(-)